MILAGGLTPTSSCIFVYWAGDSIILTDKMDVDFWTGLAGLVYLHRKNRVPLKCNVHLSAFLSVGSIDMF